MKRQLPSTKWLFIFAALVLVGCGGESGNGDAAADLPEIDNSAEVEADYAAEPDFYRFRSPADLPDGLVWESGEGL
ncbi:MAG: microcin C transport system substrate-binding protein, partial [Congregibacter sp.]